MAHRFTESELLAAVEGDLTPRQESKLQGRLEGDPLTAAAVTSMRIEREALRALDEPELPMDFLAELEPQLARPMLMESRPGVYRRKHRRQVRGRRLAKLAVAAGLLLVFLGGIWAAALQFLPNLQQNGWGGLIAGTNSENRASIMDQSASDLRSDYADENLSTALETEALAATDHPLVHYAPLPLEPIATIARSGEEQINSRPGSAPLVFTAAEFALVIQMDPQNDEVQAIISRAIASLAPLNDGRAAGPAAGPERTALVRNFSPDEAKALVARYLAPDASTGSRTAPRIASADGSSDRIAIAGADKDLAKTIRSIRRNHRDADAQLQSKQLHGPKQLAPAYEQQLAFAEGGAPYTITIPSDQLVSLLEALRADGASIQIAPFPAESDALPSQKNAKRDSAASSWITVYGEARNWIERTRASNDGSYVLLPVIIDAPKN